VNFELTEERQMLQDTLRRFLADNYSHDLIRALSDSDIGFSDRLWQQLADLGVIGAVFSEQDGGYGGEGFDLALVFEELGRVGALEPLLDTAVLAGGLLSSTVNTTHRELLAQLIDGNLQLALAHAEPRSRYELSRVETTARHLDDGYVLDGQKALVVNAVAATHVIVSARTSGAVDDSAGISLFLLPVSLAGTDYRHYPLSSGGRAAELILDQVRVEAHSLLCAEGEAYPVLEQVQARATLAICAEALGLMEAIKQLTSDYLKGRTQFGQPSGKFQVLQHRMADMLIEIEQARSAVINLAGHLESHRDEREKHVSATKNLVGLVARHVVEESIQMHGGIGVTMEYELSHLARRLLMVEHRFGDSNFHMERFIEIAIVGT